MIATSTPTEFAEMKAEALALGFKHVESGPLVRSSYHARDQVPEEARAVGRRTRQPSPPTAFPEPTNQASTAPD